MNDEKILYNYKYLKDIFHDEFDGVLETFHGTHDVGTSFPRPRHGEQYLVRVYNLECCDDGKCIGGAVGAFEQHDKCKETKGYYYIKIGNFEFQAESMSGLRERTVAVYYNACMAVSMKSVFFAPGIEKWEIELPQKKYYLESAENEYINLYDAASQKHCERYDLFPAQSFRNFIFTILLLIPRLVGLCKIKNMNRIGSFSSHVYNIRSLLLICILILKMGFYDEEFD
jgi:hypothetical protein